MKRGPQKRQRKYLSADGLLRCVRATLKELDIDEDDKGKKGGDEKKKQGRRAEISKSGCAMSAVAMFSLKAPSLLSFDKSSHDKIVANNLKTLYGITKVPSDTYMREVLDGVELEKLRKIFPAIFQSAQRGGLLSRYQFFDDGYLLALDGTQFFESNNVYCQNCCEKHHRDGKVSYYHQMLAGAIVHPDMRQVIPLCPEPIMKQDGTTKNDCETNAAHRFLEHTNEEHPRLKLTITADALHASEPLVNSLKNSNYSYILAVKPGKHKTLFDWIEGLDLEEIKETVGENRYTFRFINGVPLTGSKNSPEINFLECKAIEKEGKKEVEREFTWATDRKITKENAYRIMRGGRAKWKIENETFNTLKNQGYQLEHNFGHGKDKLQSNFAILMMIAFLVDQIQEAACGLFQAALKHLGARRTLWERIRGLFYLYFINTWEDVFLALGGTIELATLNPNST